MHVRDDKWIQNFGQETLREETLWRPRHT